MEKAIKKYDAVVIGGGPAGMMAAIVMAEHGLSVIIADKNKILGRKLRITGKGRCNITNDCSFEKLTENIISGDKFLLSSLKKFSNTDLIEYLNESGLPTVTERGGRVFPESSKAFDVAELFVRKLKELKVPVLFDFSAYDLLIDQGRVKGVNGILAGKKHTLLADNVLLATGGITYKGTGSDGSGYFLAIKAGHTVKSPLPSLIALKCLENGDCASMKGLTLKNTKVCLYEANKPVFEDFGELMFTDSGITGPTVLSMSRFYIDRAFKSRPVFPDPSSVYGLKSYIDFSCRMYADMNADRAFSIDLDLKPGLNTDELDRRVLSDFSKYNAKMLKNALSDLLPVSAIEPVIKRSGIDRFKQVSMISKQERASLVNTIKHFRLTPLSPDDPDHGVVTQGGVSLREIDPSTMSSKLCPGLFFAGEIIDADGLTGGYNLTIAFSTGRQAGNGIVNACSDT